MRVEGGNDKKVRFRLGQKLRECIKDKTARLFLKIANLEELAYC
jgi:hypothetical protein